MAFMLNGMGTTQIGKLAEPDGSYRTTEWIVLFFVPIIPLKTYRVLSEGALEGVPLVYMNRKLRVEPLPLDKAHVFRIYRGVGILVLAILIIAFWTQFARHGQSG